MKRLHGAYLIKLWKKNKSHMWINRETLNQKNLRQKQFNDDVMDGDDAEIRNDVQTQTNQPVCQPFSSFQNKWNGDEVQKKRKMSFFMHLDVNWWRFISWSASFVSNIFNNSLNSLVLKKTSTVFENCWLNYFLLEWIAKFR